MKFYEMKKVWVHEPEKYSIEENKITITTMPHTDYWQRTYYGFQNDNAHTLVTKMKDEYFSFVVKTEFNSKRRFDQCGVIIYQDSENWIKASIEYENEKFQRLGSVVTNNGYSDWATTDIPAVQKCMYYRISRRKSDICIENSYDGKEFKQMRIAHLVKGNGEINIGIYACSPEDSSFDAVFSEAEFMECMWKAHV